jgi:hypothetical protein
MATSSEWSIPFVTPTVTNLNWQLTSQNKNQTQAPTSSRTDNDEVIKHMRKTEVIKHMPDLPRVAPIRRCHRRLKDVITCIK